MCVRKGVFLAGLFALATALVLGTGRDATAGTTTITCDISAANNVQNNTVTYDHSAGTCILTNNAISPSTGLHDAVFFNQRGGNEEFRIGNGVGHNSNTHNGCSMGSFTAAAGVSCHSNRTGNTTETATVTYDGDNGSTIQMTVSYTLAAPGDVFTYNSGSVTITRPDAASAAKPAAQKAVQGSVSRSQSVVIGQNFGSRVASASGPGGPSISTTTAPDTRPDTDIPPQSNLSDDTVTGATGTTLRGLAMIASFDTSRMLSLTQNADDPAGGPAHGPAQRAALTGDRPFTIWGHGSFTDVKNTRNRTNEDNRYNGDVWGYNLGADYRVEPGLVVGLTVGFSQTDISTTFESGTYQEDTWNVSPYVIFSPSDTLAVSAIAGYAYGDVDHMRDSGITGSTKSKSWYLQVDARQSYEPFADMPFRVTAGLGTLLSRSSLDAYSESDGSQVAESTVNTVQLKPNAELAYSATVDSVALTPYVKAAYLHDFTDKTNGDAGAFDLGGGLRIVSGDTGWSGGVEGTRLVGRDDYREYTFSGLVAYGFTVGDADGNAAGIASPFLRSDLSSNGAPTVSTGVSFADLSDSLTGNLNVIRNTGADTTDARVTVGIKF